HLAGDLAEAANVRLHAAGRFAGRHGDLVHGADELGHAQHQRVLERAHVLVRAGQHFLKEHIGLAQPPEQGGGVRAQDIVRLHDLVDGRRRGFLGLGDRLVGGLLQAGEGAVDAVRGGLAGGVDEPGDLLGVFRHRAREAVAALLDDRHRLLGRLGDLVAELKTLVADGGEQAAALVGEDGLDLVRARRDFGGDAIGLADEAPGDVLAEVAQRLFGFGRRDADRLARIDGELAEIAFGVGRVDLDRVAQLLEAGDERVRRSFGAILDNVGNLLGAAGEQLLEPAVAHVERLADRVGAGADPVRRLGGAGVDVRADVGDAAVERADHLLAAFAEGLGHIGDTGAEQLLEAVEALVEVFGQLVGAAGDALVEAVEIGAHRFGDVLGARAETLDQLAAVGLHGVVELADIVGDEVAEVGRVARDLLAELGAVRFEQFVERLGPRGEHVAHGLAAIVDGLDQNVGIVAEGVGDGVGARDHRVGDARAGLLDAAEDFGAAGAEILHE